MKHIIIADIDGTIQEIGARKQHLKTNPPEYDIFHSKFMEDNPIKHVCTMISTLQFTHRIIFVTQRPMRLLNQTIHWLVDNITLTANNHHTLMRADNDTREPWIVKPELITNNINVDDILFAIDDDDNAIKAYCKLGIECIKVVDTVAVIDSITQSNAIDSDTLGNKAVKVL